ncbi:two-component system, OmpR family, sensor histidine kinase MtrB [Sanguibacter gelidistatuariae]|uniref:Sensor histidine kinase MtrB n=1 Tax=Sanguibacter gelidistatuariae TaxID=1814289 RepID=A0A1G6VVP2_9MICO|nr:two-component system, OmpR family, sensor histidine kinase MtrB [Sanguibacter gelidistatuariae]
MRRRSRRVALAVRRGLRRVQTWVRGGVGAWRSSIQLRVTSTALAIGVLAVVVLSAYLSGTIRDGLFDQRIDQVLTESTRSAAQAQATLTSTTASTAPQVQQLLNDMLPALQAGGSGGREVFLWRSEGNDTPVAVLDISTAPQLSSLVTQSLREATTEGEGLRWQSVAIPQGKATVPGVMVGTTVEVPVAGTFEMYFLYSFEPEQQTLSFMQRVLAIAGGVLITFLAVSTWTLARQVVRPVQRAAQVAERLADGHLDERLLVKGTDEMATLARSFNEMAASLQDQIQRLDALSTVQRRFVSDVSHELRTPLTTVRMASEMIYDSREGFDPVVKRSAELLVTQLDRFEDLLADLLEISRFDAGAAILDAESLDLRDVVSSAIDQSMSLASRKGVWLSVTFDDERATADMDRRRVERVVRNLLVNAIEYADNGPVEVRVAKSETAVAVHVRDYGIGMAKDQVAHVFDRFWRADPARARTSGGTGLGLAISQEDALLHGGWLDVWGRPGLGAAFRLTLPRRAGIVLSSSPIDLEPERPSDVIDVDARRHEAAGPSSLPDIDDLDTPGPRPGERGTADDHDASQEGNR